ncbi:MAG: endolytic transglycosylase MltG [Chitinophagaceae bacterium]
MKKKSVYIFICLIVLVVLFGWMIFGPATTFKQKSKYIYIYEGKDVKQQVTQQLNDKNLIHNKPMFNLLAAQLDIWKNLKSGRFEIKREQSVLDIIRILRNNTQSPVKLVINKLRTNEDFAKMIGKNFSTDSTTAMHFFMNADSLKSFGVDSNTLLTLVIPGTYFFSWNTSLKKILEKFNITKDNFWKENNRLQKAEALKLTPTQVYTLASIVEEETNKNSEKDTIASVYLNRLNKNIPLQADPTIKFALKNFALTRIYFVDLAVSSPYNTYKNKGLPPGPICTPSPITIDAVLNEPKTDYLFFVAKSDFSGHHHFSTNYAEHQQYAKQYQQALDEWMAAHPKQ